MSKSREGPNITKFPQSKHQHSWQLCEQGTMQNKSLFSKRAAFSPLHFMSVQYSHYVPGRIMVNGSPKKKSIVIPNAYIGGGVVCTKKYVCSVWLWYLVINIHLYNTDFIFLGGGDFYIHTWSASQSFHCSNKTSVKETCCHDRNHKTC